MSLSCSCEYDEYHYSEPGGWYYEYTPDLDFSAFSGKRSKRCCSCKQPIRSGEFCLRHPRVRYPYDEIESQIKCNMFLDEALGDEATISIANYWHCETCGEIFLNLRSLGFECICPDEDMKCLLDEYREIYKPPKLKIKNSLEKEVPDED